MKGYVKPPEPAERVIVIEMTEREARQLHARLAGAADVAVNFRNAIREALGDG